MIDPSLQQFLEQAIDSPIKLQLLLIYHENPRLEATSSQIANRIYRDIWSTREALRQLCEDGILSLCNDTEEPRYRYSPRPEFEERIKRLVQCYNEPLERDAVQSLLREVADNALYRRTQGETHGMFELQVI